MLRNHALVVLFIACCAVQQAGGDCSGTIYFTGSLSNYVATCTTWTGDIILPTSTPNAEIGLNVGGLFAIEGNLIIKNAPLRLWSLSELQTIGESLVLNNLPNLNTLDMPNLEKIGNVDAKHLHGFTAGLKSPLVTVGNISIQDTSLSNLDFQQLTNVQNIKIDNNPYLTSLEANQVKKMDGDLIITNNEDLKNIDGFSDLQSVEGNIEFIGDFNSVQLPALGSVRNMTLNSSQDIDSICKRVNASDSVQGVLECNGKIIGGTISSGKGSSDSDSGSGSRSGSNNNSGLSSGAKAGIGVGVGVGALLVIALFSMFFIRRRRKLAATSTPSQAGTDNAQMAEVDRTHPDERPQEGFRHDDERRDLEQSASELPAGYPEVEMGRSASSRHPGVESRYEK